jgi:hypothetical protein
MELDPRKVLKVLKSKGITHLYHANTVRTACTFIRAGGLLSRGAVEDLGLEQTPQTSDDIDKKFDVWYDVFLDSSDLHTLFNRQNHYGPVLFKFNVDVLTLKDLPPLWVTKNNPIYWDDNSTLEDRYFQSIREFDNGYTNRSYRQMITLRYASSLIPFEPYLEEILLDDPKVKVGGVCLLTEAINALKNAISENEFILNNVERNIRQCYNCWCHSNYLYQRSAHELKLAFFP